MPNPSKPGSKRGASKPGTSKAGRSARGQSKAAASKSASSKPGPYKPGPSKPAPSKPAPPKPGPSKPDASQPNPADLAPIIPLLQVDLALSGARAGAVELLKSDRWQVALKEAVPESPLLVQRLDREDRFYYIVSFKRASGATCRMLVDTASGEYTEAGGVESGGATLTSWIQAQTWLASIGSGSRVAFRSGATRTLRPEAITIGRVLGWKPCRESSSPFKPFYLIYSGLDIFFLRVDGKLFDALHPLGPGS